METQDFIAGLTHEVARPVKAACPWTMFGIWSGVTFTTVIIMTAILGLRVDISDRLTEPLFVFEAVLLLLLVLSAGISAFWHAFPDFRQQNWALHVPFALLVLYAGLLLFRALWPAATAEALDNVHSGLDCALCITLFAPLPAGLMLWQIRRGATVMPQRTGLLALLVAGSVGHLLLKFVEANDGVLHLLTYHLLPILALGVLGWLAGRKILAW